MHTPQCHTTVTSLCVSRHTSSHLLPKYTPQCHTTVTSLCVSRHTSSHLLPKYTPQCHTTVTSLSVSRHTSSHLLPEYCVYTHHTSLITSKHVAGTPTSLYNDTTSAHTETSATIAHSSTLLQDSINTVITTYVVFKPLSSTAGWCYMCQGQERWEDIQVYRGDHHRSIHTAQATASVPP